MKQKSSWLWISIFAVALMNGVLLLLVFFHGESKWDRQHDEMHDFIMKDSKKYEDLRNQMASVASLETARSKNAAKPDQDESLLPDEEKGVMPYEAQMSQEEFAKNEQETRISGFMAEPLNFSWAEEKEQEIFEQYEDWKPRDPRIDSMKPSFTLQKLKCKSKQCMLEVEYNDGFSEKETMREVDDMISRATPECGFTAFPLDEASKIQLWFIECY